MKQEKLLNKYIKYNSKITFDIFKLMYQKLIDLGFTSPHTVENAFKEFSGNYPYFVMELYTGKPYFNQYSCNLIEQSEISVEDLLEYNPVESFKLPEKWYIEVGENAEIINKWKQTTGFTEKASNYKYMAYRGDGYNFKSDYPEYSEITIEQFKQYVLKEPVIAKSSKPFPTHWCIELNKETIPIVGVYYNKKHLSDPKCATYTGDGAIGYYVRSHNNENEYVKNGYTNCSFFGDPSDSYPEITLEQFKEFIMNEPVKIETISKSKVEEVVPEYVECYYSETDAFIINKIYKCGSLSKADALTIISEKCLNHSLPYEGHLWKFRPSTKEAFEAQNKTQSIEKWSVGSYGVVINSTNKKFPIGFIDEIIPATWHEKVEFKNYSSYDPKSLEYSSGLEFKWFATKLEAEEFAKTLVKSVECKECKCTNESSVDKPKQLLKQAVECKTQEEWDFACDKYNKPSSTKKDFPKFNTFDYTFKFTGWYTLERYLQNGYQILSFQEWCDLNGYKMTKTRFKKGDYVVSLRPEPFSTVHIKYNYCYIQYKDGDKISIDSGTTMYEDNINYARLATPEEIEEYKRIGKPYDVTTLQSPTINTYGLNVGDKLDAIIIAAWEKKGCNYFSDSSEGWIFGNGAAYDRNRKIENFKVIDGVVGFLVSGTLGIYLRAEGFKEFADNYYTEIASNFKVGSWYKYNGFYLKYSKTDNRNIFIASEYINTEDDSFKDDLIDFTCGIANGSKELVKDLSVIQQYLPEGHPDKIVKNPIFEIGKWYKNLGTYNKAYGKFLKLDNSNQFWVSEYIYENEYSKNSGWFYCSSDTVECSLEEIQKFLPEGHPNKFIRLNGTPLGIKIESNSFYGSTLVQRSQFNKEEIYFLPDPN